MFAVKAALFVFTALFVRARVIEWREAREYRAEIKYSSLELLPDEYWERVADEHLMG